MTLIVIFILMMIFLGLSLNTLKEIDAREYNSLGGNMAFVLPLKQICLMGYFLSFGYRKNQLSLGSRAVLFLLSSLLTWLFIGYVLLELWNLT